MHGIQLAWECARIENAIENAIVLGEATRFSAVLPISYKLSRMAAEKKESFMDAGETFKDKVEAAEKLVLEEAIRQCNGNKSEAAKILDISLRTMRYKISKYGL